MTGPGDILTFDPNPNTPAAKHKTLVTYLKMKVEEGDWHGVSDAANDLRVLEAQHPELKK